jgi:hypothetical protein
MWKAKVKAASLHLAISAFIALCVVALVYLGWYRDGLSAVEGVGSILLIMLGIDVVLGPLMTLLVYKTGKKTLIMDLSVIAFLQAAFLAYGVYSVELGRPAFIAFEENRFETVSYADMSTESRQQLEANTNPKTSRSLVGPTYVVAVPPSDPALAQKLINDALAGGAELSQMPKYYADMETSSAIFLAKAKPLDALKAIKGNDPAAIAEFVKTLGREPSTVKYVPLKGKSKNAVLVVDAKTGQLLSIAQFKPWP